MNTELVIGEVAASKKKFDTARQMLFNGKLVRDVMKIVELSKGEVLLAAQCVADAKNEALNEAMCDLFLAGFSPNEIAKELSIKCDCESMTHRIAKALVCMVVKKFCDGDNDAVKILRKCSNGHWILQNLPDRPIDTRIEYCLHSGRTVDVAIFNDDYTCIYAIEIAVFNYVKEKKEKEITVPWLELKGSDVLKNYNIWIPIKDRFDIFECCCEKEN